jgi:hypothetical protein
VSSHIGGDAGGFDRKLVGRTFECKLLSAIVLRYVVEGYQAWPSALRGVSGSLLHRV